MHSAAHAGEGNWLVQYPTLTGRDGQDLHFEGILRIIYLNGDCSPAVEKDSEVMMLDPRAVITNEGTGEVVYGPSSIPLELHSKPMAEWIQENPEWEAAYAPNGVPKIQLQLPGQTPPNLVIHKDTYIAPRVGTRPQDGREIREAECGHKVYVSAQGIDAVEKRGKRLLCSLCMEAIANEKGASLSVTDKPV